MQRFVFLKVINGLVVDCLVLYVLNISTPNYPQAVYTFPDIRAY